MGLFSKKKNQQQAELVQISFEGEQPILTTSFKLEYEDIFEGLKVAAQNRQGRNRALGGSIILTAFTLMAIPFMFQKNILTGAVFLVMASYLVVNALFGEALSRKAKAKEIADQSKQATLTMYKAGIKINDGNNDYNISYRLIKVYESKNAFMALLGKTMMLSFPKRSFGEDLKLAREIFIANLGLNRRFFEVDEKGKAKGEKL